MASKTLTIEKNDIGSCVIVIVHSETLDAGNSKFFRENIQFILENSNNVLIDLSQIKFLDSSGLGALLFCLRTLAAKKGTLKLIGLQKAVKELFELVKMNRIFTIVNSIEEATQSNG